MIYYGNELYHHGIKGQKWGVRRFQRSDGSLTNAGRKRYNEEIETAKKNLSKAKSDYKAEQSRYNKATAGGMVYNQKAVSNLNKAGKKVKYAKDDLRDAKLNSKLQNQTKKGKRQQKLEEKYKSQGMSDSDAALSAYKRVRTEHALAAVGTMTVAAAAAYGVHKYRDVNVDRIISSKTTLHRLTENSNVGVHDAFYAAYKKSDTDIYKNFFGRDALNDGKTFYNKAINIKDGGLKLASRKSAAKALSEMLTNDKTFAKDVADSISDVHSMMNVYNSTEKQRRLYDKAIESLQKGVFDKNVYDAFNTNLVYHDPRQQKLNAKFYSFMKSKGYDAIKDINDFRYSDYNAKDPIIVFNKGKTVVSSVKELHMKEVNAAGIRIGARAAAKYIGTYGASVAAAKVGVDTASHISDANKVKKYRKEHPNTKLSNKEIISVC